MRFFNSLVLCFGLFFIGLLTQASAVIEEHSLNPLYEKIKKTSVMVEIYILEPASKPSSYNKYIPFEKQQPIVSRERLVGTGSGVILDMKKGLIVTNNHVAGAAPILKVKTISKTYNAKVIVLAPMMDLALIKVEGLTEEDATQAAVANSDVQKVGDVVVVLGAPKGLEQTFTSGIISTMHRHIGMNRVEDFIQTDTAVNPGNSGGGMYNLDGELIGITSAGVGREGNVGLNFSISSNLMMLTLHSFLEK